MSEEDKFLTEVKALVTDRGKILIGKNQEEWQIPGGFLEHRDNVREAIEKIVKDETGLETEVHQSIDITTSSSDGDSLEILFHCVADSHDPEALEDFEEVKWVSPDEITEELNSEESERLENREKQASFLKKMKKMPSA